MINMQNPSFKFQSKGQPLSSIFDSKNSVSEGFLSAAHAYSNFSDNNLFSRDTNDIASRVTALKNPISPAFITSIRKSKAIDEQLFDATSSVKILTSQVAMYLDAEFRNILFSQIDYLHDQEDWDPDDKPIQKLSFTTFLRTILFIKPKKYPGLGLSFNGNLIATWLSGKDRLTIEFLANDQIKLVLSKHYDNGETDRSASQTSVSRLLECLSPYKPESWFFN